ncbi:MAG: tetratricopeptide repeat protein [Acidobacteriota bacterium]
MRDIVLVEIEIPGGTMTRDRKQFTPIQEAYYQASQYLSRDDLPSALKAFERVVDLLPDPPFLSAIYTMMGMVHVRVRNQDAAIKAFREAIRLNETAVFAHLFLGTSLMTSKRFQEAIGPIQKASELDPSLTHVNFYLAYVYSELGQMDDAIAAYNAEIVTHGHSQEANKELAKLYVRLGDEDSTERERYYLKALETYRAWAASADPKDSETNNFLAYLYSNLRAVDPAAIEAYEKAAPNNVFALFNLGTAYLTTDRNHEAKVVFAQLTELGESGMREKLAGTSRNLDVVRSSLGEAYQKLGATSLKIYQAQTDAESRDRSLLLEAENAFKIALSYVPGDINSLYCLGITYYMMGWRAAAIRNFREVLKIEPNNIDAANNLRGTEEEVEKIRHWLESKVRKQLEIWTAEERPVYSDDLLDEIAEARAKIYEGIEAAHQSDVFTSDDLLQALVPLMKDNPSPESRADLAARIFLRGWLSPIQAVQLTDTDLTSFLIYLHLTGVSINDLVSKGGSGDQKHNDVPIKALKKVLEMHPDDERARSQLQLLLQQRLDEKLQESGLLKEVRGPITDLSPYRDRTLLPVGSKPLSEIVVEDRR